MLVHVVVDGGIVDEYVELADLGSDLLRGPGDALVVADVQLDGAGSVAGGGEPVGERDCCRVAPGCDDDVVTACGQCPAQRLAEPAGRSGDENGPAPVRELHAAGDYPNQHPGDGIGEWVKQERDLVNTDVVLWHTFGTSHLPRPEDWPIMPCEYIGFTLKPVGFFDRNPSLDVPPPPGHDTAHCHPTD